MLSVFVLVVRSRVGVPFVCVVCVWVWCPRCSVDSVLSVCLRLRVELICSLRHSQPALVGAVAPASGGFFSKCIHLLLVCCCGLLSFFSKVVARISVSASQAALTKYHYWLPDDTSRTVVPSGPRLVALIFVLCCPIC